MHCGCRRRQRVGRRLIVACRHIGKRLRGVCRVQRVRQQHGVVDVAFELGALCAERMECGLPVVCELAD